VVAQQLGELGAVGRVLVDAELEVLGELLVEGAVLVLVLRQLAEQVQDALGLRAERSNAKRRCRREG